MFGATAAAYASWSIPWMATFALLLTAWIYTRGWRAIRRTRPEQFPVWRLVCFLGGLFVVWLAIASPLDAFAGMLLVVHMVQHLLLMALAPPLLVLGAPMVPMLRGLPQYLLREGIGPFFALRPIHAVERLFGSRIFAWFAMNLTFLGWHAPALYDLALYHPAWHEVEHACFLLTSVLFWWHIIAPWPTTYKASRWLLLPFLLSSDLLNTGLSAVLSFSGRVVYPFYGEAPRVFGFSALSDQVAAGSLMWVMGSMSFLGAAMLITVSLLSNRGARRKVLMAKSHARMRVVQEANRPSTQPGLWTRCKARIASASGDLLRVPLLGSFLRSRYGRQGLQGVMLLIAAAVIVDGLVGHQMGSMNLAGIIPWTYGRGLFVLGLLVFGNLFCMACPFTLPRDLAKWLLRRTGIAQIPWPRALRNKWLPAVLVALFFWGYEALDLWDSPLRSAVLLIAYFVTAFAIDAVFRDASFCKYVCPLGQFNFASSLLSPVTVAPRSLPVCGTCSTRDCIAGHGELQSPSFQRGCELHLFQPEKSGNMDCTLCMDCVKACPHDNVGLFTRLPGAELIQLSVADPQRSAVGRYAQRLDIATICATVIAAAFAGAALMVAPVVDLLTRINGAIGNWPGVVAGLFLAALIPALLLLSLQGVTGWMRPRLASPVEHGSEMPRWVLALLPLGLGMWAAHLSFHLVTAWNSIVPGVLQALSEVAHIASLPAPDWASERPLLGAAATLDLQLALLCAGLLGSLYTGWRLTGTSTPVASRARVLVPWGALAVALYAAGIWILLQPMEMRGMVGMSMGMGM